MIQLNRVSFGYSKRHLLFQDLNMNLESGRIYGLLGKNGAGKSSLLRNMAGLLYPLSGSIDINGFTPKLRTPSFLQDIYFLPEEIHLPPVTMGKYVELMAPFYPNFDHVKFNKYISEFDIPEKNKLTGMSYGQKKKVLIAFALATQTKVLLMDEPTNGLDIPSKSQFRKVVSSVLDPDRLILISTHQVRDLDNLIDEIIILEDSQVLIQHSLQEISERLYFGVQPQIDAEDDVIHSEVSFKGYKVVAENPGQFESRVDLEQLFNATINNPGRIKALFQN